MVNFNLAYTTLINPPNATPVLTVPQIWQGLQRKIRHAEEFVPVIVGCEVLEEKDGVVTREATFQKNTGPGGKEKVREVVYSFEPSWVDFVQEDGAHIRNIVSHGPSGDDSSLNMTYMFEMRFPDMAENTPEATEKLQQLKAASKMAVEKSIETIREMVKDGRIKS